MTANLTTDSIGRIGVHAVGAIVSRLGWFFREQPTSDFGIDAHAEAPDKSGYPSGRLLGLQIKAGKRWFRERNASGVIYRGSLRHLEYWTEHSLPVALVLYEPEDRTCLWVQLSQKTIEQTAKGWKILVPFSQALDETALKAWNKLCTSSYGDSFTQPLSKETTGYSSILKFASAYCEVSVHKIGKRYRPELYVPRQPDTIVWNWLTDPKASKAACNVILERAGSGKTNLICHMAQRLLIAGRPCVVLLGSDPLENRLSLTFEVLRALGFEPEADGGVVAALEKLADAIEKTSLSILIDAVNETRDVEAMQNALAELFARFRNVPVRILITCRDIYWQFINGDWIDILPFEVQSLNLYKYDTDTWPEVRDRYLTAFKIRGSLSGDVEEKRRHPLLLRFFCEAYENEDVSEITQIRLKPLFERYLQKKVQHVAVESRSLFRAQESVTQTLQAIAGEILTTREVSVSEHRIPELTGESTYLRRDSIYIRLLDEDIILEEVPDSSSSRLIRRVRFVYEAFLEFMLAREMSARWSDKRNDEIIDELVRFLEPSACLRNTLGALSFLSDFFVARKLSPWLILAERGTAWQSLVLSSLRECDIDELDTLYKDVFPVLLVAQSFETRAAAVELLEKQEARQVLDPNYELLIARFRSDKRREVRSAALRILLEIWGELGSPERVQIVEAVLDPSTSIRKEALEVVRMLNHEEQRQLFKTLVRTLESNSGRARSYAAMALNLEHWPDARPHLLNCLQDPNAWVRRASLIRLQSVPKRSDIPAILPLLVDVEARVRSLTAILCGRWHYPKFLPSLLERIEVETDQAVLSRLVEAVISIGSPDKTNLVRLLRKLLNHPNYWVRSHAGTGLFNLQGLYCVDDLVDSILNEPPVGGGWFKRWPGIDSFGGGAGIVKLCQADFVSSKFSQRSGAFMAGVFSPVAISEQEKRWPEFRKWLSTSFRRLPIAVMEYYFKGLRVCEFPDLKYFISQPGMREILSELLLSGPNQVQPYPCFFTAAYGGELSRVELEHIFAHPSVALRESLAWGISNSHSEPVDGVFAAEGELESSDEYKPDGEFDIPF